jgi:two-component system chemotaxis sensor kinase CheA
MVKKRTGIKKAASMREYWAMTAIVALFFMGTVYSLYSIWFLRDASRAVNYAGMARGSSLMLVSREIMGLEDDGMVENMENIITELSTGLGPFNLTFLRDPQYSRDIQEVRNAWEELKVLINGAREERSRITGMDPRGQTVQALFASSQDFYKLLNAAAASAEAYSGRLIFRTMITVIAGGSVSLLLIVFGLVYMNRMKRIAEAATEEISVMKDNLSIGVFLMSKDLVIQPQYSKILEKILGEADLFNRKFTDLLTSSLSQKELETLTDYFAMIINQAFDTKMLEEINPVDEFHYVNIRTREEKKLRCAFALVDQGKDAVFILGTIEDITSEKLLEQQLSEEENKREEEMRTLFEVIQVEPRVFSEFLEDTEFEFDRINDLLKNKELNSQTAMLDIFQSVHAIKSNAIILGLENFSRKMQALETEIKKNLEKEEITFEDILHITVEIERVMREKDNFQTTVKRIQTFKIGDLRNQDEYVLVQSLVRACGRAARDTGKKAEVVIDRIDPPAIERGPRRIMKEVLTQLVRNAVYHGIEMPSFRISREKNETGQIHLSIAVEGDKIHIILTDDGQGLDFNQIREKAKVLNLLTDSPDTADTKQLVQAIFIPGFSTAEDTGLHAGRGIGLSLVRDRLYAINGSVKLHTEEGKGTIFHIFIPLDQNKAPVP